MRRLLVSLATAAALVVAVVPAALGADPSLAPVDAVATPAPTQAPDPTATPGPYDGTIVEDPTFVSGGELSTQAPGSPRTRLPGVTPPPTDAAVVAPATTPSSPLPLFLLAASALIALLASPVTRTQRAARSRRRA